jgi:hypothetical protein
MKKKEKKTGNIYICLVILLCIVLSIFIYFTVKDNKKKENNESNMDDVDSDVVESSIKPFDDVKRMIVEINGVEYNMTLENNLAAMDLLSIAPIEMDMEDLNSNEKYNYLSYSLSDSDTYTGTINKGDVMLYQSNCIVIFYKDFETTYSYIKLGHIDGLEELNNETVKVIFK